MLPPRGAATPQGTTAPRASARQGPRTVMARLSRDTGAMSHENVEGVRAVRIALDPLSERASLSRTLDERLSVRFPGVYRLLADAFTRLRPRSRLRRLLIARRVRHAYAAANRRDFELVLTGWDPRSEYRPSADLTPPDVEPVFHGHDGMRQLWRYWLDAFQDIRWDPQEI